MLTRTSLASLSAIAFALSLSMSASAQTPVQNPNKAQLDEARQHMQAGSAFYNDPSGKHKCEEAYREFKKAYLLSGSLNAVKGMAVCSLELERDGEAIKEYDQYLNGKGKEVDAGERAQIENDLKALKASVANVTFSADAPTFHIRDTRTPQAGYPIINAYDLQAEAKIGVHPGSHTFVASADGYPDVSWSSDIANGTVYEHRFDFAAAKAAAEEQAKRDAANRGVLPPTRPIPKAAFVTGGLTIALAVPTIIFGIRALGKNSDYKAENGNVSSATSDTARSSVKSANLVTDVFLGATVAAGVVTGVLYFTRPTKPADAAPPPAPPPSASLRIGPGSAAIVGQF